MRRFVFRYRLRTLIVFTLLASLMLAYWGCYYRISRRNAFAVSDYALFDYTGGIEELNPNPDWRENYLRVCFAPANWTDRTFFNGPHPMNGTRGLR